MKKSRWIISVLAVLSCVGLLLPLPWTIRDRLWHALEDLAHFPLFALIAMALWLWLNPLSRTRRFWSALSLSVLLAVGVELLQRYTHRDPSIEDVAMSALGALAGVLLMDSFIGLRRPWRVVERCGVFALLVLALIPVSSVVFDRARSRAEFPLIASFERRSEWGRWSVRDAQMERVRNHATEGKYALRFTVVSEPGPYPAAFMTDGIGNWEGYSELCLDIFLPGASNLVLWLRADDEEDYLRYADRAQIAVLLEPGENRVCVELSEFLRTPSARELRRDHLKRLGLFLNEPEGGEVLFVDNIRLRP